MARLDELPFQHDSTGERYAYLLICELSMAISDLFYRGEEGADVPAATAAKLKGAFLDLKRIASYFENPPEIGSWWTPSRGIPFQPKTSKN